MAVRIVAGVAGVLLLMAGCGAFDRADTVTCTSYGSSTTCSRH